MCVCVCVCVRVVCVCVCVCEQMLAKLYPHDVRTHTMCPTCRVTVVIAKSIFLCGKWLWHCFGSTSSTVPYML